ncbi:MAG: type II toxin-antitoxin system RelE family toxin [Patescibacteria group bacterium]
MDKIAKALESLSAKEREIIKNTLLKIKGGVLAGLDVKKLKNCEDIYRVRKGKLRIIFRRLDENNFNILAIERRSDNTYGKY